MIAYGFCCILDLFFKIVRIRSEEFFLKPIQILFPEGYAFWIFTQRHLVPW